MDDERFDDLTKTLVDGIMSRRDTLKGVVAGALALALGSLGVASSEAGKKGHKKHKKHKKRCPHGTHQCNINGAGKCCATSCCLFFGEPAGGETFCRLPEDVCCSAAEGGGSCDPDYPYCCPPTEEDPEGYCGEYPEDCETSFRAASAGQVGRRAPRGGRRP